MLGSHPLLPRGDPATVRRYYERRAPGYDRVSQARYFPAREVLAALPGQIGQGVGSCLDLGCGTGQSGALLRPLARRLTGCDLSRTMVTLARRRGVYDAVHHGDFLDLLAAEPAG